MDAQKKVKLNIPQLTLAKITQLGRHQCFCGPVITTDCLLLISVIVG